MKKILPLFCFCVPFLTALSFGAAAHGASDAGEPQKAARVAYCNRAVSLLDEKPYAAAEICRKAALRYLEDWRLQPCPKVSANSLSAAARRLAPPQGLFDEHTAGQIRLHISDMDKHLEVLFGEYRKLEKYVNDARIVDDGEQGKTIVVRLTEAFKNFAQTRNAFLRLVEEAGATAEDELVEGHPLRRQIVLAREIFSRFGECAVLLRAEQPDKEALAQVRDKLEAVLTEAGKPPFRGAPGLERAYRHFLKEAENFSRLLSSGLEGTFHVGLRQGLNEAITASRKAYNDFAALANRG
ncbi:MAG: hypothetical protein LBR31_00645 [Desulfovibrio sp.]|jgi:hypothetical protein|nr:hypothetical protein [Desulfovibrio sp.]